MVNIAIAQDGTVTGDKGKIIGYVSNRPDQYSEPIKIIHPRFEGCSYFLQYRYNQTLFTDALDAYDNVQIHIIRDGYVKCQLVATDIATGAIKFKSYVWTFIIKPALDVEPSHYDYQCAPFDQWQYHDNSHYHHCHGNYYGYNHCRHQYPICMPYNPCHGPGEDIYKVAYKMNEKLENEEDIRFQQYQELVTTVEQMRNALHLTNPIPSSLDANELVETGIYLADESSINFPNEDTKYKCEVSLYDNIIMQLASEIATIDKKDNLWYRTGIKNGDDIADIEWIEWAPLITRVMEG